MSYIRGISFHNEMLRMCFFVVHARVNYLRNTSDGSDYYDYIYNYFPTI